MSTEYATIRCRHCDDQTEAVRETCDHVMHLFLSVLCWLWIPVWVARAATPDPWCCTRCGNTESPAGTGKTSGLAILVALVIAVLLLIIGVVVVGIAMSLG